MARRKRQRGGGGTRRVANTKRKRPATKSSSAAGKSKRKKRHSAKKQPTTHAERIRLLEQCAFAARRTRQSLQKIEHDPAEKTRRTHILAKRVITEYPVQAINNNRERYLHSICYPVKGPSTARGIGDDVRFAASTVHDVHYPQ